MQPVGDVEVDLAERGDAVAGLLVQVVVHRSRRVAGPAGVEVDLVGDEEPADDPVEPAACIVAQPDLQRGLAQLFIGVEAGRGIGRAVAVALDRSRGGLGARNDREVEVVAELMLQGRRQTVNVDVLRGIFGRIELVGVIVLAGVGDVGVERRRDPVVLARLATIPTA